jgi:hypothetical protein
MLQALALLAALPLAEPACAARAARVKIADVPEGEVFEEASQDGFHVGSVIQRGAEYNWALDGRAAGEDRPGTLDLQYPRDTVDVSRSGRKLAYVLSSVDERGAPKETVYVNGKPAGPAYDGVYRVKFGPNERLTWVGTRKGDGQRVVVDGVEGPPVEFNPSDVRFTRDGSRFAYVGWQKPRYRLFLNHAVLGDWDGPDLFVTEDWSVRAANRRESEDAFRLSIEGKPVGPAFTRLQVAALSADGRHSAAFGKRTADRGQVHLDGKPSGPEFDSLFQIEYVGAAAWWVGQLAGGGRHAAYRDGKALGSWYALRGYPPLAFSRGGRSALLAQGEADDPVGLVVDGKTVLSPVPAPLIPGGPVFDGEYGVHWVVKEDGAYWVYCVSLSEDQEPSACERTARRLHGRAEK